MSNSSPRQPSLTSLRILGCGSRFGCSDRSWRRAGGRWVAEAEDSVARYIPPAERFWFRLGRALVIASAVFWTAVGVAAVWVVCR